MKQHGICRAESAHPDVDTLSLGMSDDMEAAIAANGTMVRMRHRLSLVLVIAQK